MINIASKRRITFYLTLDSQRKKLFTKYFCYSLLKKKDYPELDKDEVMMEMNHFDPAKLNDIVQGKFYHKDFKKVYEGNENLCNEAAVNCEGGIKKEDSHLILLDNQYNPYHQLEKSKKIDNLHCEKLNSYKYFSIYDNFLKAFDNNNPATMNEKEKIDAFIKCLCKIYYAHNIHERINNEISKRTNLYILKGDYFFSLGYYQVTQIGNPLLIRFYSKIAENFSRKFFHLNSYQNTIHSDHYEAQYVNLLIKKYIGFIYYGCCGLKELHFNSLLKNNSELIKELSFKYGLLLYLREELAFLKDKSFEYYTKVEDLFSIFLLFSEKFVKDLINEKTDTIKVKMREYITNTQYIDKYKYLAANVSSDLIEIIDNLKKFANEKNLESVEEMKNYIRVIFRDVENLARL